MGEITGAQLVVESLQREGVDTVYILPGDPVGPIVVGCAKAGLRCIAVRHEQVAALAAQGHSFFTHSVGVCIAASGVGQTNTLTGIANAYANYDRSHRVTGQDVDRVHALPCAMNSGRFSLFWKIQMLSSGVPVVEGLSR